VRKFGNLFQIIVIPAALLLIGGVASYKHFSRIEPDRPPGAVRSVAPEAVQSAPTGPVDGKSLGRAYAPVVASCLGDAWLAAADSLERGESMEQAQAALQVAWRVSRARSFAGSVAPVFAGVLPAGTEPTDPARRAEVVRLWRAFASGLKGEF
jgi:hypothetical protein